MNAAEMLKLDPTLSKGGADFIDDHRIASLLFSEPTDTVRVREIIAKSLAKNALSVEETAVLLRCTDPQIEQEILEGARTLKRNVYGNRIVLFAPLYIGSLCVNDCEYCGFKRSNHETVRTTLDAAALKAEVKALEDAGHKRLILVFGEHPRYDAQFIADSVRTTYAVQSGEHGEIRRVNVNAAPMDHAGFRTVRGSGIGTWQIFQETYHHATYARVHGSNTMKSDYLWRLDGMDRAMESGIDDVGLGALFGLYDWRFEVLGLVSHALHLQQKYRVGPHTISFPRLQAASGVEIDPRWQVSDKDFAKLVAVLRLAVPYTGLILTAREPVHIRNQLIEFGVSQIDGGTKLGLGSYSEGGEEQDLKREQFHVGDTRSLDQVMQELINKSELPSFCTACYRLGRTGEHFMEFAVPGFIKKFCTPNALTTLQEYLVDYAPPETRTKGQALIASELAKIEDAKLKGEVERRLELIRTSDARDLYF